MRVPALLLAFAAMMGCGEDDARGLRWELTFPSEEARARAQEVNARIVRGGCDGTEDAWSQRLTREDASGGMSLGPLPAGPYGFFAEVLDADCDWFLRGCVEVELPRSEGATVTVPLATLTPTEPAAECVERCPLPRPFDAVVTWSESLHVSSSGDDTASGTREAPLATLGEALARTQDATAPTRIVLMAGTHYAPQAFYASELGRTLETALKIEGEDGATVAAAAGEPNALSLHGLGYVVIENLEIEGGEDPLRIERDGPLNHHVVLRDLRVANANECIRVYTGEAFWVEGLETVGCDFGLRFLAVHDSYVVDGTFRDSEGWGVGVEGASSDVLLHGNTFRGLSGGVRVGGGSDPDFWEPETADREAARVHVVGNVFESVGTDRGQVVFASCDACVVANNTMIDPRYYIARILDMSSDPRALSARDGRFVNNLIVFEAASGVGYVNLDDRAEALIEPETFTFGWNLFVPDDPSFTGFPLPARVPPDETSRVADDAGLRDLAGGDYHIEPGSAAAGAGTPDPALAGVAPGDFDDVCWASPPSVGAFQAR